MDKALKGIFVQREKGGYLKGYSIHQINLAAIFVLEVQIHQSRLIKVNLFKYKQRKNVKAISSMKCNGFGIEREIANLQALKHYTFLNKAKLMNMLL